MINASMLGYDTQLRRMANSGGRLHKFQMSTGLSKTPQNTDQYVFSLIQL